MRTLRCVLIAILASHTALAQDLSLMEREMRSRYEGQVIPLVESFKGKDIVFDSTGRVGSGTVPACGGRFKIESLRLTKEELVLRGRRELNVPDFPRPPSSDSAPAPLGKTERQTIHILSGEQPWDRAVILAGIDRMQHLPPVTFPNPPGYQPAPPAGDRRILYLLPDGPVYRVGDGIATPRANYQPDPEYPEAAQQAGACGSVRLKAVVQEDGTVAHARTSIPPTGWGFDEKSVEVIRQWRFQPAQLDGRPVKVEISIDTNFRLY